MPEPTSARANRARSSMSDRFTETELFELYVDLWGLSPAWIEKLQAVVLDFADPSVGDEAEAYSCPACMAVRFRTLDRSRVAVVRGTMARLLNLARSSGVPLERAEEVYYVHP